ncbi:MAG: Sortase family protein [Parcubacteria group bacterium ADurb.Bin316]|nr:MAG: Sortase family protein [Parcubacteria group bacterium ADurb.Bin316]HOZ56306.1 sortase [bacterium]
MKINFSDNKKKVIRALVFTLELLALTLLLYIFILPVYPLAGYKFFIADNENIAIDAKDEQAVKQKTEEYKNSFPQSEYAVSPNRLIITKIGVNAPIVETKNEQYGLSKGAWHIPESSTPDKGGNTVITGHRFKYLPPNNLTFYLLDKLEVGDIIAVIWKEENYYYRVRETKVVPDTDFSVLNPSDKPIITLFTCTPIYSTEKRLVVVGDLIE